jgi:hypothetical protein
MLGIIPPDPPPKSNIRIPWLFREAVRSATRIRLVESTVRLPATGATAPLLAEGLSALRHKRAIQPLPVLLVVADARGVFGFDTLPERFGLRVDGLVMFVFGVNLDHLRAGLLDMASMAQQLQVFWPTGGPFHVVDFGAWLPTNAAASFVPCDHGLSNIQRNTTLLPLISAGDEMRKTNLNGVENIGTLDAAVPYATPHIADQLRFLGTSNGAIELCQSVPQELLPTVEAHEGNKVFDPTAWHHEARKPNTEVSGTRLVPYLADPLVPSFAPSPQAAFP